MHAALTILAVLIVLGITGIFFYDLKTKKYELISMRNVFLLGFLHFFGLGTYLTASTGVGTATYVPTEKGVGILFLSLLIFIVTYIIFHLVGRRWNWFGKLVPPLQLPVTKVAVLASIAALLAFSIIGAVLPFSGGVITAIISQFRNGAAAAAIALATYNLLARKFNPVAWCVFLGTLGCAMLLTTVGDIGRRGLLGIFMAIGWIWWYYSLRYRSAGSTMFKLGGLMAAGTLLLLIYTGFRSTGYGSDTARRGMSLNTRVEQFSNALSAPTVRTTSVNAVIWTDTAANAMFIMENYPDIYSYDPFHGLKMLLSNPIPRQFWPDKPRGLGLILQEQMQTDANLGVGIVGHGWAEGGFIGVFGYAAFFGAFLAACDTLIRKRAWNPYFLAAMGSSLGNVCALPRGETSLFLLQVGLSFFGVMIVLYPLKFFLGPLLATSAPLVTDGNRAAFEADDTPPDEEHFDEYGADPDHHASSDTYGYRGAASP